MNRKGFTLVELLATLVILGLVVSIGGVSVTKIMTSNKEKNYETLVANIKSAIEMYYQECNYGRIDGEDYSHCNLDIDDVSYKVKASTLIDHGYINPNNNKDKVLEDPRDNNKRVCQITYSYSSISDKLNVSHIEMTSSGC